MKCYNLRALCAIVLFSSLFMISCRKDQTIFNTYFYVADTTRSENLSLYINHQFKGMLPRMAQPVTDHPLGFNDPALSQHSLRFQLPSGSYMVEARNNEGLVLISGTIRFSENSGGGSGGKGLVGTSSSGSDLEVWMHE